MIFGHRDGDITSWKDLLETTNIQVDEISAKKWNRFLKYHTYKQEDMWTTVDENNEVHYFVRRNHGVIFGFDEIHLTFESTSWQDAPDALLDYISQQRKLHKQIIASSQVFTRINKKLREQTNYVIECRCLFGRVVSQRFYRTPEYITNGEKFDKGARKRRVKKRYCFVAKDEIRRKYNTEEIMKDLQFGKNKVEQLNDILESLRVDNNESS